MGFTFLAWGSVQMCMYDTHVCKRRYRQESSRNVRMEGRNQAEGTEISYFSNTSKSGQLLPNLKQTRLLTKSFLHASICLQTVRNKNSYSIPATIFRFTSVHLLICARAELDAEKICSRRYGLADQASAWQVSTLSSPDFSWTCIYHIFAVPARPCCSWNRPACAQAICASCSMCCVFFIYHECASARAWCSLKELQLDIPWKNLRSRPVIVKVTGLNMVVCPNNEVSQSAQERAEELLTAKRAAIAQLDAAGRPHGCRRARQLASRRIAEGRP